ncbi:nucleoside deaminase [Clostridium paridis]|uniref:tRNA-specific adenosine deaminase n=1 Tax=Clostridium paridis TaxID=2803863 RepID=A0A937FKK6_9CLOT|nr:nucleoside deaminase [Clostridium paridis]MBL4933681.1 nucleoside deaminase [Clostridium paridis]
MSFMEAALKEAYKAKEKLEVPVGAVIVKEGKIIAEAHNLRETLKSPLAHAEILAINKASKFIGDWRLSGCELYVSLEPCVMCAGAIIQSRISKVHIGTFDPKAGACGTVANILNHPYLDSFIEVSWEYNEECSKVLIDFFKDRRNK